MDPSLPVVPLLAGWALAAVAMLVLWVPATARRDATPVDVGWVLVLVALAALHAAAGEGDGTRRMLLAAGVACWGQRLTLHLLPRALSGAEDPRYARLRERWGDRAGPRFFLLFQAQALSCAVLSTSYVAVAQNTAPLGGWDVLGAALLVSALAGEWLADRQLAAFRRRTRDRQAVCDVGLWRLSRHPNYFFEWLHWCAWVAFAATGELVWLATVGPLVMLWLLLCVTGIPPAEERALSVRGDAYREYQRTTSAFVPWLPRRARTHP